ncbi:hypothetical protein FHW69_001836 [Luteibacter sp. Sphag1AF]|uniref:CPBP family intramembrane glutamic endopeptidase n=1 Tax=Luteibacter sp. Sphag1AF TaxID=2587031 RepID=UPI00161F5ADB|nr:CPBP family intramembrane glutamic endopeptidase [Luteibacter sp. Sphag1AF]MBB3227235.1 hypothetical protein [Luteibacter sp. Sphag1AF]
MTSFPPPLPAPLTLHSIPAPNRPAPKVLDGVGAMIFYFIAQLGLGQVFGWLARLYVGMSTSDPAQIDRAVRQPDVVIVLVVCTLLASCVATYALVRWRWRDWMQVSGPGGIGLVRPSGGFMLAGFVFGTFLPVVGALITNMVAQDHEVTQAVSELADNASMGMRFLMLPVVVLAGPFVEELIFRGALYGTLRARYTAWIPGTISALVFGMVHLPDLSWAWYAVPNLVLIGATCAWLRERSGSLWPSIAAHAVNNALASAAWFVAST